MTSAEWSAWNDFLESSVSELNNNEALEPDSEKSSRAGIKNSKGRGMKLSPAWEHNERSTHCFGGVDLLRRINYKWSAANVFLWEVNDPGGQRPGRSMPWEVNAPRGQRTQRSTHRKSRRSMPRRWTPRLPCRHADLKGDLTWRGTWPEGGLDLTGDLTLRGTGP